MGGAINQKSFAILQKLSMKINPQKINMHRSYQVKELAGFLSIDKKTCFRWIDDGLKIVEGSKKPILIMGQDLKEFLSKRKQKRKFKLKRCEFFCLSCKKPTNAKKGSTKIKNGKKLAVCRVCSSKISRTIKPRQKDYTIYPYPT